MSGEIRATAVFNIATVIADIFFLKKEARVGFLYSQICPGIEPRTAAYWPIQGLTWTT